MSKSLKVTIGLCVALLMVLASLLGLAGSGARRPAAGPDFACAVILNTYGVCVGPPTNDRLG